MDDKTNTDKFYKFYLIGIILIFLITVILLRSKNTKDTFCHCSNNKNVTGLPSRVTGDLPAGVGDPNFTNGKNGTPSPTVLPQEKFGKGVL